MQQTQWEEEFAVCDQVVLSYIVEKIKDDIVFYWTWGRELHQIMKTSNKTAECIRCIKGALRYQRVSPSQRGPGKIL